MVEECDESLGGSASSDRVQVDVVPVNNTTELKEPQVDGVGYVTVNHIMDKAPRAKIQEYTAQDPTLAISEALLIRIMNGIMVRACPMQEREVVSVPSECVICFIENIIKTLRQHSNVNHFTR